MLTHAGPQWKPVFNCLGIPWVKNNVIKKKIIIIIIIGLGVGARVCLLMLGQFLEVTQELHNKYSIVFTLYHHINIIIGVPVIVGK